MNKPDKIERLKARKEEIEKQLAELQAKEKAKARKEETRLKILIGAGIMANVKIRPELKGQVQKILDKAITESRDRKFLQEKGWLPQENAGQ